MESPVMEEGLPLAALEHVEEEVEVEVREAVR